MINPAPRSFAPNVGTQSDGALREDRDAVTRSDVAAFGTRDARRCNIGKHEDLFVREFVRHHR